jgi:hypothetical protein
MQKPAEHIKVVIKQQTELNKTGLKRKQAGALTNSTVTAIKNL